MNNLKYNWDIARENMQELRVSKGLSQATLALDLGWGEGSISHYETGKNIPNMLYIIAFCGYFGISIEDLFKKDLVKD